MRSKNLTVLVVSGDDAAVKQLSFSRRLLPVGIALLTLASLAMVGLFVANGVGGAALLESSQLRQENALLEDELSEIRGRLEELDTSLEALAAQDARYRQLAGLDEIDNEVLQVGVGDLPAPRRDAAEPRGVGREASVALRAEGVETPRRIHPSG